MEQSDEGICFNFQNQGEWRSTLPSETAGWATRKSFPGRHGALMGRHDFP